MIIKKFMAKDSRNAMAQIRDEFGPDAILLSSKTVGDHFEMVAAPNYDDQTIEQELAAQVASQNAANEASKAKEELIENKLAELERLNARDQHSLEMMQDEMAQLRKLLQAQLELEVARKKRQEYNRAKSRMQRSTKNSTAHRKNNNQQQAADIRRISSKESKKSNTHIDQYLAEIGLSSALRASLQRRLQGIDKIEMASSKTMQILSNAVRVSDTGKLPDKGIAVFVGAQGVGKTTALIKIAQCHRKQHGVAGIGFISLGLQKDSHAKAAAKNKLLEKYSESLGIECIHAETPRQLAGAIKSLSSKKLLLIDCVGKLESTSPLFVALTELQIAYPQLQTFLTMAADASKAQQEYVINAYADLRPSLIVTKLENSRHLGGLVELMIRKKVPLGYIAESKKLDTNITAGDSEKLIRMALDLGKLPKQIDAESGLMGIAS